MIRIDIEVVRYGHRGASYCVRYAGETLIAATRCPEFDAARALLARGITGRLEVWRPGAAFPAMILDIVKAATLTVREDERRRPEIVPWVAPPQRFSMPRGRVPAGVSMMAAG
jgi:hypothetical protein